jgi:hypothetical protein
MSGKINKKIKGTKQQPTDPGEPLAQRLFQEDPPKTPKAKSPKNKKTTKTGVGKSSESLKGLGGLGEDTTLDSEKESVDSVSLSEDRDESDSEQFEIDNKAEGPNKQISGIGKNQSPGSVTNKNSVLILGTTTSQPVKSLNTRPYQP